MCPERGGAVVLLGRDGLHSAEVVQHPHLSDVELGEEPVVVRGPVDHLRVSAEQSGFRHGRLAVVHLKHTHRIQTGNGLDLSGAEQEA